MLEETSTIENNANDAVPAMAPRGVVAAASGVVAAAAGGVVAAAASQGAPIFEPLVAQPGLAGQGNDIELILDIPVQLTVELGRTRVPLRNILQLAQGSVIELDGLAGEPLGVLVNGCLVAQGEVVVVNEKFGIRLTDIVAPTERMRKLKR